MAAFGVSEWAFRLPSALAGIGWAWAVWHFARPRFGPDTALLALAITSTALGPLLIGRAATADALLNLLLTLTLFDLWRHLEGNPGRRAPLLRAYLWMGLGFLTKGPVAVVLPAAITLLYCASRGDWRRWLQMLIQPAGWAIFVALTLPWYAYALALHGQAFIDGFILRHNVQRFTGTLEGHAGSLFYYVLVLPLLLLPWSSVLIGALRKIADDRHTVLRRFLWVWAGFVLMFFSLSGTKLPHYALYGSTPLFLLIAAHRDGARRLPLHAILPTLALAALPLLPWLLGLAAGRTDNPFYVAQLAEAPGHADLGYYLITIAALLLWLVVLALRGWTVWQRLLAGAVLQVLALTLAVTPFIGAVLQQSVKEAGLKAHELGLPAVTWRFSTAPSFSVYRQAATPARLPEPGELVLLRIGRQPEPAEASFETVYQRGGVQLLRRVN